MRGFKRHGRQSIVGILTTLAACPGGSDMLAQPTSKGGPNDPNDDGQGLPWPGAAAPTTTDGPTPTSSSATMASDTSGTSGSDAASTTASTTTSDPEGCGDGVQGPGEQCDAGYQHNSDAAACTATCTAAICGDGLVWADVEQCDHGANNNDSDYGGCTVACTFGPRCGDGVQQPDDEECDPTAPLPEGVASCEQGTCRFMARVAFVTTAKFSGALGGLALADVACSSAAAAAGLDNSGSFKAWISDGVASPQLRLKKAAADTGYPYARRDGQLLADDLADLIAHGPKVPLDVTETSTALPPLEAVWTNIGADAQPFSAANHCKEWTSEALLANARAGMISPASAAELPAWKATYRWTSDASQSCITLAHLYCFED